MTTADDDEGTAVDVRRLLRFCFPRLLLSEKSIYWLSTRLADRYEKPYSAGCDTSS